VLVPSEVLTNVHTWYKIEKFLFILLSLHAVFVLLQKEVFSLTLFSFFALDRLRVLCSGKGNDDDDSYEDKDSKRKGTSGKGKSKGGSHKGENDLG
jgi:hypothetical protein